jgi:hypothetical protein
VGLSLAQFESLTLLEVPIGAARIARDLREIRDF